MQGEKGGREGGGCKGSKGTEKSLAGRVMRGDFSFTPLASLTSYLVSLALLLALSSCSRTVATEPGVVNFLIESMPTNLDPRIGIDGQSERIDSLMFDSLIELDDKRIPHGDLAEKWEMPDPATYVFHLRPGIKFHDGRPLTSADVIVHGTDLLGTSSRTSAV